MATTDTSGSPPQLIDEINYEVGQDNIQRQIGPFGLDIHNPVFLIAGLGIVAFVLGTLMVPDAATSLFESMRGWVTGNFSWFFILGGNIFVLFGLLLIVTPLGAVRLGGPDARPDYGYAGWFAMLFAAGMGIGLMFYGVSEPLSHYATSVAEGRGRARQLGAAFRRTGRPGGTARDLGMAATIYHWGLHPWAMYAVVASGAGALQLQHGPAALDPLGLLPDLR